MSLGAFVKTESFAVGSIKIACYTSSQSGMLNFNNREFKLHLALSNDTDAFLRTADTSSDGCPLTEQFDQAPVNRVNYALTN
jgi:hypothetical protein